MFFGTNAFNTHTVKYTSPAKMLKFSISVFSAFLIIVLFGSKSKKWSATFHIVWRIPIVLYVFCSAIDQKLGLSRKFGAEVFDKRLLSPHNAMHQQRPRIIAGLPPSGQTTYSCFCIDEVGLLHSVRLSVRCLRFTQNQNVVETSNLLDT